MGLDDRDYMRERSRKQPLRMLRDTDRPFTPPAEGPSLVTMALTWVCVAFLLYKAYAWWAEQKASRPSMPTLVAKQSVRREPQQPVGLQPTPERAVPSVQPTQPRSAYVAPTPHVMEPQPRPQTSGTIYRCKDYSGGTFWASNHCNQHNALIDRIVSVPSGMPFRQQVEVAEQQRAAATSATIVQRTYNEPPAAAVVNKAQCKALDARVEQLDAEARQPLSAQMQDWNRSERQKARNEQFRLRC